MQGSRAKIGGRTWIRATGQAWKLWVFFLIMGISGGIGVAFISSVNETLLLPGLGERSLAFALVGTSVMGFLWLCFAIRCRRCGHRPAWLILRSKHASRWLSTLSSLDACPRCGNDGARALRSAGL